MAAKVTLCFLVDGERIDLDLHNELTPTPQVDLLHHVLFQLNNSSLNLFGRVKVAAKLSQGYLHISPAYKVPALLEDFRSDLVTVLVDGSITVNALKLMSLSKDAPKFPEARYILSPTANTVRSPVFLAQNPGTVVVTLAPDADPSVGVCFSKYPIPALGQVAAIVSEIESINQIQ